MKGLKEFQIDIFSLSNKLHEFEFEITDKLLQVYEHSLLEKGEGTCKLELLKSETMMTLSFNITGKIELTCDRSLDKFMYPIDLEEKIIIKFGEEDYSLSDDVLVIKSDTPSLNVGDLIYEFINLAVPMKKLHPRYKDEDEDQPDLIYSSQDEDTNEKNDQEVDPRWEALKKLRDNK